MALSREGLTFRRRGGKQQGSGDEAASKLRIAGSTVSKKEEDINSAAASIWQFWTVVLLVALIVLVLNVVRLVSHLRNDNNAETNGGQDVGGVSPTSFLSFDLGGSGLKLMEVRIVSEGPGKKRAIPLGDGICLGYVPPHENPQAWIQRQVKNNFSLDSMQLWPHFAGTSNDSFKLWSPTEVDTVRLLHDAGTLHVGCSEQTPDVPHWVTGINVWCKKWRPTADVLGFTDDGASGEPSGKTTSGFLGSYTDTAAHLEGARAKLEQLVDYRRSVDNQQVEQPFPFVNWGLGTGQTICWTSSFNSEGRSKLYDPLLNRTAAVKPSNIRGTTVSSELSFDHKVRQIHLISVVVPFKIVQKWKDQGSIFAGHSINELMPFYAILQGDLWLNADLRVDLREIYRTFFRDQVMTAIHSGKLPKPKAMVFSGGLQHYAQFAHLVADILEENGIESIAGFPEAAHCGIVRLAYPADKVSCDFDH
jgi:hypothetical protein